MPSPARLAALNILRAVDAGRADLPRALATARTTLADERDQALAAEIATGTLRWRAALDHLIAHHAGRPIDRLDAEVLEVLRLSAYQVLHLERVPVSAVVNDAVEMTRTVRKRSAAGFVNAVLRSLARNRHRLSLPARPPAVTARRAGDGGAPGDWDAALDYLSITLSHPRWLAGRWLTRYGFDATEAWARFDNTPAPLTLRVNTLRVAPDELIERLRQAGVGVERTAYAPHGLRVTHGNPLRTDLAHSGLFAVQDEASQLVALMTAVRPGERVLDTCASPGGKTTAMAAAMGDRGLLVAADLRARRIELLRQAVAESAATSVALVRLDLGHPLPFADRMFDCVLLDAPCSGLGTIRRDPEIRWRRSEADLTRLAVAQRLMLAQAAAAVRPGGRLVYATCSSEPEEDEEVVEAFLREHIDFDAEDPRHSVRPTPPGLDAVVNERGHLRTYPHRHGLEAFFAAIVRRCAGATL